LCIIETSVSHSEEEELQAVDFYTVLPLSADETVLPLILESTAGSLQKFSRITAQNGSHSGDTNGSCPGEIAQVSGHIMYLYAGMPCNSHK